MGCKAAETTCNINNTFGSGTANEHKVLILLQLHEKLPANNADHCTVVQHLKQIGNMKKLSKTVPKELTTNLKKIVIFKCHLLLVCATTANHFFIGM